jgi:hypothetical protein
VILHDVIMTTANRRPWVPIAVAVLCIVAIGITAATLTTATPVGASDETQLIDPPSVQDVVDGSSDAEAPERQGEGGESGSLNRGAGTITVCVEPLATTGGTIAYLAGFLVFAGILYRRFNLAVTVFVGWTVLPPYMLAYFISTDCGVGGNTSPLAGAGSVGTAGERLVDVGHVPPWAVAVAVGLLAAGVAVILYRSAWNEQAVTPADEAEPDAEPDADAFAAAAGRAADRIEEHNAAVDNAVYGAWLEMTGLLDVARPETYTPEEFAVAAVEVGMHREDVEELTELFNEVRYGEKDAEPRADRAVDVLRRIETTYADATGPGMADPDSSSDETDESGSTGDREDR